MADYVVLFLVHALVCGVGGVILAHLREKGKMHYRAWLVPGVAGSALGALLSLVVLGQFLLHIRPTAAFYYLIWAGRGIIAPYSVYGMVKLWHSVRDAPFISSPRPQDVPSEPPPGVWPPPPR